MPDVPIARSDRSRRLDGALMNALTGMGQEGVDVAESTLRKTVVLTPGRARHEHRFSWAAAREVDRPAADLISAGIELELPEWADASAVIDYLDSIGSSSAYPEDRGALQALGRLYGTGNKVGGAAGVMIIADGLPPWEPVDFGRVQDLLSIEILERDEIAPYRVAASGPPEYYIVGTSRTEVEPAQLIHRTRVILARGVRLGPREEELNQGWGASVLERLQSERRAMHTAIQELGSLATKVNQDVVAIAELAEMLEADVGMVEERLAQMARARGQHRLMPLDGGKQGGGPNSEPGRPPDVFTPMERPVRGVADLAVQLENHWAGGTGQTPSIAMGKTPGGLNTGENAGDWKSWTTFIQGEARTWLVPRLRMVLDVVFAARNGPTMGEVPESYAVKVPSLWKPTELELAQLRQTNATTDQAYTSMGAIGPEQVAVQRFVQGEMGGLHLDPLPEPEPELDPETGEPLDPEATDEELDAEVDPIEQAWSDAEPPADAATATELAAQLDGVTAQAIHTMARNGQIERYRGRGYSTAPVYSLAEVRKALLVRQGFLEEEPPEDAAAEVADAKPRWWHRFKRR